MCTHHQPHYRPECDCNANLFNTHKIYFAGKWRRYALSATCPSCPIRWGWCGKAAMAGTKWCANSWKSPPYGSVWADGAIQRHKYRPHRLQVHHRHRVSQRIIILDIWIILSKSQLICSLCRLPTSASQFAGAADWHPARMEWRRFETQSQSTIESPRNISRFGKKSSMGPYKHRNQQPVSVACAAIAQTARKQRRLGHQEYAIATRIAHVRLPEGVVIAQREL